MTYTSEVLIAASAANLDPDLVHAQVLVESGGNAFAWNPEPQYKYLWDVRKRAPFRVLSEMEQASEKPPVDFPFLAGDRDQEWWAQQASWGLMQVMGALARERGFIGPYLTELCDPRVNLHIGCMYMQTLLKWANGNKTQALAAYNGGKGGNTRPPFRNGAYSKKVEMEYYKIAGRGFA